MSISTRDAARLLAIFDSARSNYEIHIKKYSHPFHSMKRKEKSDDLLFRRHVVDKLDEELKQLLVELQRGSTDAPH